MNAKQAKELSNNSQSKNDFYSDIINLIKERAEKGFTSLEANYDNYPKKVWDKLTEDGYKIYPGKFQNGSGSMRSIEW